MLLGSLSRHNKNLEWPTLKPPRRVTDVRSWTDRVIALKSVLQLSVTALFIVDNSRKVHLRGVRARGSKDAKRRVPHRSGETESVWKKKSFGSSFYFSSPWACPMQIGLRQERCSTWSPHSGPRTFLWPSSVLFSQAFSLPCLLATAILDSFSLF